MESGTPAADVEGVTSVYQEAMSLQCHGRYWNEDEASMDPFQLETQED